MAAKRLNLPDTASVAIPSTNGRLSAPSAVRNSQAIRDVLRPYIPDSGRALEIASGTGEHMLHLGRENPGVIWQPTDVDPDRLESIAAWQATEGGKNVLPPIILDAGSTAWADDNSGQDFILLVNLLHLISTAEAQNVATETARALAPGGYAAIYGPFKRGEEFASDGDLKFHQSLSAQDAEIGYKSFEQVQTWQTEVGLQSLAPIEIPASNLMLIAHKPTQE
jgi:SAM-dependent methyltransferase